MSSPFSRGLLICRMRGTSYTMDGFCLLYLLLILLMRSGDVETNPGPNTAESTVSEMEFLKLAQDIPPSYYNAVGTSLGFSYAQLKAILDENLENYTYALLDVFMKWNVVQQPPHSNKRQLLADKLREINLGGLSDIILNVPLNPISTGGPSRLSESQTKPPIAESQTKPLSPELVKQGARYFKPINSTVSEMEFLKLAQAIPSSYYETVGISLGIPLAQLQATLSEKLGNYTNAILHLLMISMVTRDEQLEKILSEKRHYTEALFDVFMKWNIKQQSPHSNKRQLLADKLREIDSGSLSDRLLDESLFPIGTGGPFRLLESQTKPPSAESQTKPLSPELVERCANDFKFKYRSTLCKIRADPLNPASIVPFKDMYTNLVLQQEHGTEKRMLDYNDILDLKVNGEFPKRIMIQGEAGAGKTTFCAKIAWDWIEGRYFSHFVWVLIVPLREFKQHTIGEIAKSYLSKNNPATVSQITEYIRSNPDKVFIAFDGLDEVSGKIMKTKSCESQPTYDQMQLQPSQPSVNSSEASGSSSETGDIGLADILCSDQLASCPVLVTTRPCRAVEIRSDGDLMKLYTFIHVKGFNRKNLSLYIHKYFPKNKDNANRLIQFTSENDVISQNMPHYPIYVAILCLMWKELDEQKLKEMKSLKTFSPIFKTMIAFLKEHYAQKEVKKVGSPSLHAYLKRIDELLGPIAKQALNGLLENTLVFSEYDFKICPESKDTAYRVGILSQEDRITADTDTHKRNSHVQLPVFFPQKLFQEYMAGVHLASLYESDRNEFNRLIEQVVLPRKEEFRFLLYFTVSQNKSIATHVMHSMLQGLNMNIATYASQEQLDFIVDVAFESQDPDVAALVKDRVSSEEIVLNISEYMTAHTVAGYAYIEPYVVKLCVERDCGPTVSLDVAEIICSMPSLKEASLQSTLHHCFFETLARKGKESKVQSLKLHATMCPTPVSSHHLVEALCSMPDLTDLTLGMDLNEEFYSTLKAKASSIQVQSLKLVNVRCPTPASSHDLVEAPCSMPNLTDLTLGMDLEEEFYSTLKAEASSIQVQTLELDYVQCPRPASSHHLVEALCSMPNLTDLTLGTDLNEELYSTLSAKASSIKGCFPQIRKGNFTFNGVPQDDLNSFLHTLARLQRTDLKSEGSRSRSGPHKSQRPYTRSRVPQDDSEIPEKQSKTDLKSEGSRGRSGPRKRQRPYTRSRVPQDDSEIPEKQSRTDLKSEGSRTRSGPHKRQRPYTRSRVPQDDSEIPEKQSSQESRRLHLDTTDDGNQVHWDFLTDIPEDLTLQDDEAVISCGIRFSPSGAKLSKPIKVTLDHSALFSNPRRAEIVFYTRKEDSKSYVRIPASTSRYPRCTVRAKDLDLFVDHFCFWWIVAVYNRNFLGKRVSCTPYVKRPVRKESTHFVLLYICRDIRRVLREIREDMEGYIELRPPLPIFIKWTRGDINIKLFDGPRGNETEIDEKTLREKDLNLINRKRFSFEVKPLESGASEKILKFTLNQIESLSDPTLIQFTLPYDDMGAATEEATVFPPMHAGSQASGMLSHTDLESDRILDTLSKHIPSGTYTMLCTRLDIGYNEANVILANCHTNYQRATRECLAQWKTRTGGNMAQLKTILVAAGVRNLVKHVK